jgi:hypothetical protein
LGTHRGARRLAVLIAVLTLSPPGALATGPLAQPSSVAAAQDGPSIAASSAASLPMLTARPRGDGWQYSLTVAVPPERTLGELHVELTLPAGSELVEALEAPPELEWLGVEDGRARWRTSAAANSYVGPFAVTVRGGRGSAAEARVAGSGAPAGEARARLAAELAPAGPPAPLAISEQGSATLERLGDSGVLAAIPTGASETPTTWSVRTVGAAGDPPPGVAPGAWWVAMVEAAGPSLLATPLVLLLPARQPVPPGVEVRLFRETDNGWRETAARGVVAPDGLQVAVPIEVPGLYAAAVAGLYRLQPAPLDPGPAVRLAVPRVASQRCDAFGACVRASDPNAASTCTVDRGLCIEQDVGPPLVTRVCTPQEAPRTCASQTATLPGVVGHVAGR